MRINLTIIFLIACAAASTVFAQKTAAVSIRGQLLKSDGKPLPYVELELVPVESKVLVIDQRLIAASSTSGKFSFINVLDGKYTLSINFGERPSELSPYEAFFYPNTSNRDKAQVFEITATSKFSAIIFRLPPSIPMRTVTGKVVFRDGTPVAGATVSLLNLDYKNIFSPDSVKTDASGNFSIKGVDGKKYQITAIVVEDNRQNLNELITPFIAAGESDVFTLNAKTPPITFEVKPIGPVNRARDRNIAD